MDNKKGRTGYGNIRFGHTGAYLYSPQYGVKIPQTAPVPKKKVSRVCDKDVFYV